VIIITDELGRMIVHILPLKEYCMIRYIQWMWKSEIKQQILRLLNLLEIKLLMVKKLSELLQ
jgi:hypothetical protein